MILDHFFTKKKATCTGRNIRKEFEPGEGAQQVAPGPFLEEKVQLKIERRKPGASLNRFVLSV